MMETQEQLDQDRIRAILRTPLSQPQAPSPSPDSGALPGSQARWGTWANEESPANRAADTLTLPWMAIRQPDGSVTVVDGMQQEVAKIPGSHPARGTILSLIISAPWLLVAAERLRREFERVSTKAGKTGVTLRQWIRNHEGAKHLDELRHALGVAHGLVTPEGAVPASYGLNAPEAEGRVEAETEKSE